MNKRKVRVLAVAGAVCVAIAALAGLAWACTPQARMFNLIPIAADPRSAVTVTGEFVQPGATVEIHWNSADAAPMGSSTADSRGNFSVVGTVPDVAPGIYYIVATSGVNGQSAPQVARIAFEVTGAADNASTQATVPSGQASAVSSELWSGFGTSTSNVSGLSLEAASQQPSAPGTVAGYALLAVGSIGLVAGTALVARRKTRISN